MAKLWDLLHYLLNKNLFIKEGFVGHIEDVVVRKGFERKQIGGEIVESLLDVAKKTWVLQDNFRL